jgi:adenosylcobalamin-dependent ribonucleoside-triphosphate reductase
MLGVSKAINPRDYFSLDVKFLKQYEAKKPNFGFNGLGELVFFRTYSRLKPDGSKESFFDCIKRVVEGCYEIQRRHCVSLHIPWNFKKAQESAQEMFQRMWDFKFLPPGRGLWMMGTDFMWSRLGAALNNCFDGKTEIITRDGVKQIGLLVGTEQELLTTGGKWVKAPIKSFGVQELYKLTLERAGVQKIIYTTAGHRWFAKDLRKTQTVAIEDTSGVIVKKRQHIGYKEVTTVNLTEHHMMQSVYGSGVNGNVRPSAFGVAHGIAYGDGTTGQDSESCGTYLYLCGHKNEELLEYFPNCPTSFDKEKGVEGAVRVADLPRFFRRKPSLRESKSYLYGWLAGYFAADGTINTKGNQICIASSEYDNMLLVRDICAVLGIGTYSIVQTTQTVTHDGMKKKFIGYKIGIMPIHLNEDFFLLSEHKKRFLDHRSHRNRPLYKWHVKSVEQTGEFAEVYCPQVPDTQAFALADNILTGNCAFISTDDTIEADPAEPFCFLMDMAMLGVGVGFDTKGKDRIAIKNPSAKTVEYQIEDSREGWVESLRMLLHSYTLKYKDGKVKFDYSLIRPKGSPINGFGGTAAGSGILVELHNAVIALLDSRVGKKLSSVDITDIMNIIGKCVVAGNVRRTAEIAFGSPDDTEYSNMKNVTAGLTETERNEFFNVTNGLYSKSRSHATIDDFTGTTISADKLKRAIETWNALNSYRWASNNSVSAEVGMDYSKFGEQIAANGEPGFIWLQNMRDYGRMKDGHTPGIDGRVAGSNPCVEQSLESSELCCLVETFPARHDDAADFMRTLKFAYLYAKTVTLLPTHNVRTNQVMLRNRRIGLSQSGIVQAFAKFGRRAVLRDFCDAGYSEIDSWDMIYSEWLCVPKSIKKTSIKPSGSVSLLAGATPGIHYPEATTYWRTVRVAKDNILVKILQKAGYRVEPSVTDSRTMVVYFAISDRSVKAVNEVSMLEQLENCAAYQHYWADNQVSCTVKFKKHEAKDIASALELYEDQLKGISFLPYFEHNYPQAPYIPCAPQEVDEYNNSIKEVDYTDYIMEAAGSNYCENDTCELKTETAAQ